MTDNMSSWFEKGRPSLFTALEGVCRQIDSDIRAGECKGAVHGITQLTEQNSAKKAQAQRLKSRRQDGKTGAKALIGSGRLCLPKTRTRWTTRRAGRGRLLFLTGN